jgi:hypothetical protein
MARPEVTGRNASTSQDEPSWLELETIKPLPEISKLTSLSVDTLKRRYRQYIVELSARRQGMKLRHGLQITNGEI